MNEQTKEKLIQKAKIYLSRIKDNSHNEKHTLSVLEYAKEIAEEVPGIDIDALDVACWWHDVGYIRSDEGHEKISAEMIKEETINLGESPEFAQKIYDTIVDHFFSGEPQTLEGKVLKDADKLGYLPVWRWQEAIENKSMGAVNSTLKNLPLMRKRLYFSKSRELFDKLLGEFQEFVKTDNSEFLKPYKNDLLNIKSKQ